MMIENIYVKRLIKEILSFSRGNGVKRSLIQGKVLEDCKEERKICTKAEWREKGLDIYLKRGVSFDELCSYAIEKRWVEEWGEYLRLTKAGELHYYGILTNNNSESYKAYLRNIHEAFDAKQMVRPELIQIMSSFSRGRPASELMEWSKQPSEIGEESKAHHLSVLKELGYSEEKLKGHIIFQFVPELFLPLGDDRRVTLTIQGIDMPLNLVISRPYRNQRYAVGGLAIGRLIEPVGFYPLIVPKEQFPNDLNLELLWNVGGDDGFNVSHQLHITFDKQRDTGNFYSSHQQLVKSSEIPSIRIATYLPEDEYLFKERDTQFVRQTTEDYLLQEKVTLKPYPLELSFSH